MIADARAYAAQTVRALALIVSATAQRLPLSAKVALDARGKAYLLSAILSPAIRTVEDAAAAGSLVATVASSLASDVGASDAIQPFYDAAAACAVAAPTFSSPARNRAAALGRMLAACSEAAFLGQAFVAEASAGFPDRQTAVAARKRIADTMDARLDVIAQNTGLPVVDLLSEVAMRTSGHIADVAANLQPIVRVKTARSAPSSALAFTLYGDPARATDLVARNRVATPLFMPISLEALSPSA